MMTRVIVLADPDTDIACHDGFLTLICSLSHGQSRAQYNSIRMRSLVVVGPRVLSWAKGKRTDQASWNGWASKGASSRCSHAMDDGRRRRLRTESPHWIALDSVPCLSEATRHCRCALPRTMGGWIGGRCKWQEQSWLWTPDHPPNLTLDSLRHQLRLWSCTNKRVLWVALPIDMDIAHYPLPVTHYPCTVVPSVACTYRLIHVHRGDDATANGHSLHHQNLGRGTVEMDPGKALQATRRPGSPSTCN